MPQIIGAADEMEGLRQRLGKLLYEGGGVWSLTADGKGVERVVRFRGFGGVRGDGGVRGKEDGKGKGEGEGGEEGEVALAVAAKVGCPPPLFSLEFLVLDFGV